MQAFLNLHTCLEAGPEKAACGNQSRPSRVHSVII